MNNNYFSTDQSFKVTFPGPFLEKTDTLKTEIEELEIHQIFHRCSAESKCEHKEKGIVYSLTYYEIPNFKFQDKYESHFNDLAQSVIAQRENDLNGTIIYTSENEFKDLPSRLVRIDNESTSDPISCKLRILTFKDFFIVLQVEGERKEINKPQALSFLDSFKLINK